MNRVLALTHSCTRLQTEVATKDKDGPEATANLASVETAETVSHQARDPSSSEYITTTSAKSIGKKIIKWEIIHLTNQNRPGKIFTLCNLERLDIAFADNNKRLNLRSELVGKCSHFTKFF